MKAIVYDGMQDVKVKSIIDPSIEKSDDIIVKVTSTAICGSDVHLVHGLIPNTPKDFVLGHETMGIVMEAGKDVHKVKKGDRVVVPFPVACGHCWYCELIKENKFDATDIITHKLSLDDGKHAYEIFDKKEDNCIKVILKL